MKRLIILSAMLPLLAGCGMLADKSIHIYDLAASSSMFPGVDAIAGGCLVDIKGDVTGIMVMYNGDKCTVDTRPQLPIGD